ncbi:ABC transporter permease [soil metagenome]
MTAPPSALTRTLRSFDYWGYQYRRIWKGTVVSSVMTPVLFLAAMGVGLGSLVDEGGRLGGEYLLFLAPGLLAATAMQTASFESMYPVMGAIKWVRTYHAMLATPLGVGAVLGGHLLWVVFRLTTTCLAFLVVMALFGAAGSPAALLALPAAVLCGMAFAAPLFAFSAAVDRDAGFAAVQRFVLVPMFLFSGTFFPVDQLPRALEWVAYATPLWHGVDLCRSLALGSQGLLDALGHVGYLSLWILAGVLVARITFARRLAATG